MYVEVHMTSINPSSFFVMSQKLFSVGTIVNT